MAFAFAFAFAFGMTFALADCANVLGNQASRMPSFLRAHETLDSQDRSLAVGANFLGNATEDVLASVAALPLSTLQPSRSDPAPCQISAYVLASPAATLRACRCTRHRNQHCSYLGARYVSAVPFDVGLSDVCQCQACQMEEGPEKHRLFHCQKWNEVTREILEAFRKLEEKAKTSKKKWKWQRGIVVHLLSESRWNRCHFSMTKWESEKHKSWGMPAEGFKGHVAIDGSLLGTAGKWGACCWSVVQMDYDEEVEPLHGMYGSMEAVLEVQRTIKRTELTAFLCLLKKVIGSINVHVDNKGIIDGLWRGERKCTNPKEGDADLWI